MNKTLLAIAGSALSFGVGFYISRQLNQPPAPPLIEQKQHTQNNMKPGAFSVSINVKDLTTSKQFYENLGFTAFAGSMESHYLIMKNGNALIGLFHGMFEGNILTFNPGWDENAKNVEPFDDVRFIQQHLKQKGVALISETDSATSGPGSIMLKDPDGNMILIDQHR
jgi:catechol 2,3-dioxygenase-like lactoylglutathione lyase family enzyme